MAAETRPGCTTLEELNEGLVVRGDLFVHPAVLTGVRRNRSVDMPDQGRGFIFVAPVEAIDPLDTERMNDLLHQVASAPQALGVSGRYSIVFDPLEEIRPPTEQLGMYAALGSVSYLELVPATSGTNTLVSERVFPNGTPANTYNGQYYVRLEVVPVPNVMSAIALANKFENWGSRPLGVVSPRMNNGRPITQYHVPLNALLRRELV